MAKRIHLSNLVDAGLLAGGEKLEYRLRGKVYVGELNADGSISHDSQRFDSPSGWGKHLAKGSAQNGWDNIWAKGKKLSEYRSLLAQTDSTKAPIQNEVEASSFVSAESKETPANRAENANSALLERITELHPTAFEELVGEFLKAKGFDKVKTTNRSHDGGIDGECELSFIGVKVAFQAKRYKPQTSIGIEPVQRLQGSLKKRYDRGVFVTTSTFTSPAKSWIKEVNAQIWLVDGETLVQEMINLNLGVKTVPVVEHQIDESFFSYLAEKSMQASTVR